MAVKRAWFTLEESKVDAILAAAQDYGMPTSSFAGLCTWVGFNSVMRQINPEKMMTAEQWVDVIEAAQKRGLISDDEVDKLKSAPLS